MIRVGVDWGSSSFRAYQFDEHGSVVAELSEDKGIREIHPATPEHYEQVLFELIGSWVSDGDIVLLSGMITSRAGWVETPYLTCPVDVATIAGFAQCLEARNVQLRFLPGIKQEHPNPDVMRGEELQLLGAAIQNRSSTIVLPGTHSKWALMKGTELSQFRTVITGELFEVIVKNTLIGALFTSNTFHEDSFLSGVESGYKTTTLVSDLFTLRSSVLVEHAETDSQHSRLSGMLIGNEIREGLQLMGAANDVILVGSAALGAMYQLAFKQVGINANFYSEVAAVAGFQQVAQSFTNDGVNQ
jgi:2-dehydro-3-deoxygalactonokinase